MEFINLAIKNRVNLFAEVVQNTICTTSGKSSPGISLEIALEEIMNLLQKMKHNKGFLYLVGNGGSAAVASHALVDFSNVAKIHAQVLHESSLITCMANDFGYENVYSRVLSNAITQYDILIAISSSGKSLNICNAVTAAKENGSTIITFSGFDPDNPLRKMGDFNFWLNSKEYGFVEIGHQFLLHNLSDRFGFKNIKNELKKHDLSYI